MMNDGWDISLSRLRQPDAPRPLAVETGSASVGIGQHTAAQVWNAFKAEKLRYVDILEMCAVLMCNVADKSASTDHEIAHMTRQLMDNMRAKSSSPNTPVSRDGA